MTASPAAGVRLFLGLWPTPEETRAFALHADAWSWPASARRTPAERLHLTLHFIGSVPVERLPSLRAALDVPWRGGQLVLDRTELWPGGIAVLEASRFPPALQDLHMALGEQLRALELPVEQRRWRPHLTLARKANGATPPPDFQPLRWTLPSDYLLLESLPGGRGYVPLARFG